MDSLFRCQLLPTGYNANVKGAMKIAILNLAGREMQAFNMGLTDAPKADVPGYGLGQCDTFESVSSTIMILPVICRLQEKKD